MCVHRGSGVTPKGLKAGTDSSCMHLLHVTFGKESAYGAEGEKLIINV